MDVVEIFVRAKEYTEHEYHSGRYFIGKRNTSYYSEYGVPPPVMPPDESCIKPIKGKYIDTSARKERMFIYGANTMPRMKINGRVCL